MDKSKIIFAGSNHQQILYFLFFPSEFKSQLHFTKHLDKSKIIFRGPNNLQIASLYFLFFRSDFKSQLYFLFFPSDFKSQLHFTRLPIDLGFNLDSNLEQMFASTSSLFTFEHLILQKVQFEDNIKYFSLKTLIIPLCC